MRLESVLPFIAAVGLVVFPLPAQERLPASYQAHLATWAHVETLTLDDVTDLTAKAQAGVQEAQYFLPFLTTPMPTGGSGWQRSKATQKRSSGWGLVTSADYSGQSIIARRSSGYKGPPLKGCQTHSSVWVVCMRPGKAFPRATR